MKVLFVRSGNNGLDPITQNQGTSLSKLGLHVIYYDVVGKGIFGYLNNISKLIKFIKEEKPDIIHSHYSLSGYIAYIASSRIPVVCSLMGSDVLSSNMINKILIHIFGKYFWKKTIVKSKEMADKFTNKFKVEIIPNGVNLDVFHPIEKKLALEYLGWDKKANNILFPSNPERPEKNYSLAKEVIGILLSKGIHTEVHFLANINPDDVFLYYNAADVTLLTSKHEGSPNVIKEAMACNCPIVTTNVGDVLEVIGNTKNCFICKENSHDISSKVEEMIKSNTRTNGRENIKKLDSVIVSKKLAKLYSVILNDKYSN